MFPRSDPLNKRKQKTYISNTNYNSDTDSFGKHYCNLCNNSNVRSIKTVHLLQHYFNCYAINCKMMYSMHRWQDEWGIFFTEDCHWVVSMLVLKWYNNCSQCSNCSCILYSAIALHKALWCTDLVSLYLVCHDYCAVFSNVCVHYSHIIYIVCVFAFVHICNICRFRSRYCSFFLFLSFFLPFLVLEKQLKSGK